MTLAFANERDVPPAPPTASWCGALIDHLDAAP